MNPAGEAVRAAVEPLLPGFTLETVDEIDSTSTELMRRARAGRVAPVLLVAKKQTAGRGRLGRAWLGAEDESLTFSLGMQLAPGDWAGLSLAVGVTLAEALDRRVRLKWPNDLWVDGRKLAGILIETASFGQSGHAARYAVVGIGINIHAPAASGLSTPPCGMDELEPGITAGAVLFRIAPPLVGTMKTFESFGFAPFHARFDARDALRDRAVVLSDGTRGTAHGIGAGGCLLVHTPAGMTTVTSSEVSVRPLP